ncbi:MAG: hypothetical protein LBV55_04435 [Acholeplasmatales bacterium]|jgi:hypothetical protein|nr:hypothetical protein [Acholeplasmatales bacterium]
MSKDVKTNVGENSVNEVATKIKNYGVFSKLLKDNQIKLEKNLRSNVLKEVLGEIVASKRKEKEGTADDTRYRLGFFTIYSEYQLQNLLFSLKDKELEELYLVKLFNAIREALVDSNILEPVLAAKSKNNPASIHEIDRDLDSIFEDIDHTFDALDVDLLRPVLYHASLNEEIRELGLKYGVEVPKRLKKAELIDYILSYFPSLADDERENLRANLATLPPTLITRFAKDNNILVSQDIKKEEIIEYILKHSEVSAADYRRPYSKKAYYFTDEQRETYGLVDVKAYVEEELVPTVPTAASKEIVYVDRVVEKEVIVERIVEKEVPTAGNDEVIVETVATEPEKTGGSVGLRILLAVLLILQVVALLLVIYFVFFA